MPGPQVLDPTAPWGYDQRPFNQARRTWFEFELFAGTNATNFTNASGISDGGGNGTGTWQYLNAYVMGDSLGSLITCSASSAWNRQVNLTPGSTRILGSTMTFELSALNTSTTSLMIAKDAGGVNIVADLRLNTSGQIVMRNNLIATGTTGTTVLTTNTTYQLMWLLDDFSAQQGWRLYDANGVLLEERLNGVYNRGAIEQWHYGIQNAPGVAFNMKIARPGYDTAGWIAPVTPASVPLTGTPTAGAVDLNGSTAVGTSALLGTPTAGAVTLGGANANGGATLIGTAQAGAVTLGGTSAGSTSILLGAPAPGGVDARGANANGVTVLLGTPAPGSVTAGGATAQGGSVLPGTPSAGSVSVGGATAQSTFALVGTAQSGFVNARGGSEVGVFVVLGTPRPGAVNLQGSFASGGSVLLGTATSGFVNVRGSTDNAIFGLTGTPTAGQVTVGGARPNSVYALVGVHQSGVILTMGAAAVGGSGITGFNVPGHVSIAGARPNGVFGVPITGYIGWGVHL